MAAKTETKPSESEPDGLHGSEAQAVQGEAAKGTVNSSQVVEETGNPQDSETDSPAPEGGEFAADSTSKPTSAPQPASEVLTADPNADAREDIPAPEADKIEISAQPQPQPQKGKRDFSYTQNRELSWLQFDKRVMEEALGDSVPLLERLRFISIFETNLDEFFMVRVGSLTDLTLIDPDTKDNKSNLTPAEQLDAIYVAVRPLIEMRDRLYEQTCEALGAYGFEELDLNQMSKKERKFARDYFKNFLRPILSPQVIDQRHPFPHLRNKKLYIAAMLTNKKGKQELGIVGVPEGVPAFISDPEDPLHIVRVEKIIAYNMNKLFDIYKAANPVVVSVTRNADISFDEEKFSDDEGDYRLHVSHLLKKRQRLNPVRLEIEGEPDEMLVDALLERLQLTEDQVYISSSPNVMSFVFGLSKLFEPSLKSTLCAAPFAPRQSKVFDLARGIIEQVEEKDRILFYPYDSMDPFLHFLQQAAADPDVVSIKITLYRLASDSRVAQHLIEACEAGKDVTVLMELRARFDEANNIDWSERLEQAGCTIIYGMENYKCHSKICLVTRREEGRLVNITQIGTGNYNEKTARVYTDLCLFTADESIGRDAVNFFQNMLIGNLNGAYESLLVAPANMKQTLMTLIDREIARGADGRITLKCNSVTDRDIIDKLSEASRAGVQIRMNVRGISCLLPGIEGKTENIHVRSIVGEFLEHSRIYCFGSGEEMQMFIASADLMTRNLVHRVEVGCPIYDEDVKDSIWLFLEKIFLDNTKARSIEPDGGYAPVAEAWDAEMFSHEGSFNMQSWCVAHPLQEMDPAKEKQPAVAKPRVRASKSRRAGKGELARAEGSGSGNGLPPIGQRTLWQRIKAVFLGD